MGKNFLSFSSIVCSIAPPKLIDYIWNRSRENNEIFIPEILIIRQNFSSWKLHIELGNIVHNFET